MLNIFLTNLGKYVEGELVGEWVKLPISSEELTHVQTRIGIGEQYEEMFISDYECDYDEIEISEYTSISHLNKLALALEETPSAIALVAFLSEGLELDAALTKVEDGDYCLYSDCNNMTDVAYEVVEQTDLLHNVPESVKRYFDYEAFGRDLSYEGHFHFIGNDCLELFL